MTHDETLAAVLAQLAEMRAALAEQREINAEQREAISALREEMRQQAPSPEAAAWLAQPEAASVHDSAQAAPPEQPGARRRGTSRRGLLRTAAAGAAAAAVATVAAGNVEQAHAATGGNLILGQYNDAAATTTLSDTSGANTSPDPVLQISSDIAGVRALAVTSNNGSYAIYTSGANTGLYANATNTGIHATSAGTAILGETISGYGVVGSSQDSYALFGISNGSYGVVGQSGAYIDLAALGSGRMFQKHQSQIGTPTNGGYSPGESIRDANGDLWLCIAGTGISTAPADWIKMAHLAPGFSSGGAITYLSKPIRLLDTRAGATDALFHPGAPYTSANPYPLQVAGDVYNSVTVPTSLAGAIGNVTVVNPAGGGYIALVPHGVGFTGTAILAYNAGQTVSNSFNVGVVSGQLDIIIGGAATNVIVDLFAVVA